MVEHNQFLRRYFEGDPEYPQRFYALVDQDEGERLLLDAVGADFFDQFAANGRVSAGWGEVATEAPIFVIELRGAAVQKFRNWFGSNKLGSVDAVDEAEAPAWCEVWQEPGGGEATIYHNLYTEGRPLGINGRLASIEAAERLRAAFSLDDHLATPAEIVTALLNLYGTVSWVAVYDVGQGGANGICDANEAPLAYFDLGGGVLGNATTFPAGLLTDFCYAHSPPVILSHWDWDHWSSGNTFPKAQTLKWIVPNQDLGAVHATFAAALAKLNNLLVWPLGLSAIRIGSAVVRKCQHAGRNHSGLALEISGPANEPPILLTGDARYTAVPGAVQRSYTALVAPHHGANMKSHATPVGGGLPGARTAYSYGFGNTFSHPKAITEQDHHQNGWPHSSQGGAPPIDRQTATRPGGALGHIGLTWVSAATLPGHACTQFGCAVELVQT